VAFGRLAVIGARDAQLAGDEVIPAKPRRSRRAEKPSEEDEPAVEDGERPNVWRRLTAAR
jgi:hypothetical protein